MHVQYSNYQLLSLLVDNFDMHIKQQQYLNMLKEHSYLRKGTEGLDLAKARITVCARPPKHQKVGQ